MDAQLFAQIIGPVLCVTGLGLSLSKELIDDSVNDLLSHPTNQFFSAITLLALGSIIIVLFHASSDATYTLGLGYLFFLAGFSKLLFTSHWIKLIESLGDRQYIQLIGTALLIYGLIMVYFSMIH